MKKLLASLLIFIGLVALSPSVLAIDAILHDIADHTIGRGHHNAYYGYNHSYGGYPAYSGYSGYGHRRYSHTRLGWSGGHHRHHSNALSVFGHGRGRHRGH